MASGRRRRTLGDSASEHEREFHQASNVGRRVLLKAVLVRGVWQTVPRGCWRAQTAGINPTKRKPGVAAGGSAPVPGEVKPVGGA